MAVEETNIDIDGEEMYVRAAIDCATLQVLAVEVSLGRSGLAGRSNLDALLFLENVLDRCRGCLLVWADRGLWCDWPSGAL